MEEGSSNLSSGTIPSLEHLPSELVFEIFDFTPLSVFNLRLVSQSVKSRVDEYVLQKSNIVEVVKIVDQVYGFDWMCPTLALRHLNISIDAEDNPAEIRFNLEINKDLEQVFELRIKLMRPPFDLKKMIRLGKETSRRIKYHINCNLMDDEHREYSLKFLGNCMGHRIGRVDFGLGHPTTQLPLLDSLLEGIQFSTLVVYTKMFTVSSDLVDHILQIIKHHGVEHLEMVLRRLNPSIDSIKFLLDLSKLIRTLHIIQHKLDDIAENQPYLLGVYNEDWSRIILELFSNKMDRLKILNFDYGEYLQKRHADVLRKQLPLLDKQIWLWITCIQKYYEGGLDYLERDYSIRAFGVRNATCGILAIAHASRRAEDILFL